MANIGLSTIKSILSRFKTRNDDRYSGAITSSEDKRLLENLLSGHIPEGRELTESWTSLKNRISIGDFSNIRLGDYKTVTLSTGEVITMDVAGIDTYYRYGDVEIGHHVDFISREVLFGGKKMNLSDINNGTAEEKHPWIASEMYTVLNDEKTGIITTLPNELQDCIIPKMAYLEERYSSEGTVSADTARSFASLGKLWFPSEIEVFGYVCYSDVMSSGGGVNIQYPIFRLDPRHIIKTDTESNSKKHWWELSAAANDSKRFCTADNNGTTGRGVATNSAHHATLCFRIG